MLNVYSYTLYWGFGLTMILLENFNKSKSFTKFKIQPDKNTLKEKQKLKEVINVPRQQILNV